MQSAARGLGRGTDLWTFRTPGLVSCGDSTAQMPQPTPPRTALMPAPSPATRRELTSVKVGLTLVAVGLVMFLTAAIFPGLVPPLTRGFTDLLSMLIPGR
jgi:hypothetical protein